MMTKSKLPVWMAACLAIAGFPLMAGDFTAPAEGPVAFRRDQIPLDPDAMAGLSKQLELLARALDAKTPAEHRAAAQMLALAVALDPANSNARGLITEYEEQKHKPGAEADRLEKARAKIWQYLAWLDSPEAGNQGRALAACLKDVIIVSDPKHPQAAAIREGGEKGAWAGWIPPLSAYQPKAVVKVDVKENPVTEEKPALENPIHLESATVQTLLWQRAGKMDGEPWVLAPAPLKMTASIVQPDEKGADRFSVIIGANPEAGLGQTGAVVRGALEKIHGKLPPGVRINITSRELEKSPDSRKRQPISAAAAVLASSALSGRVPEAIILGQVNENGAFKLTALFWDQLLSLGKGTGQRLVLPAEAAPYLSSILALEKPEFFLEYEVLLAADFQQLLDLSAKTPEGALASAVAKFRGIRERAGTQDVRQYIGNTFVKQRLAAVIQDFPAHVSAKMLLIQASGNRPLLIARAVLASELRRALEPMAWYQNSGGVLLDEAHANKIGQTYDECRTRVEALDHYAEKNDRVLMEHTRDVMIALRNIDRAARSRGDSLVVLQNIQAAHKEFSRLAQGLSDELATEAGDGPVIPNR